MTSPEPDRVVLFDAAAEAARDGEPLKEAAVRVLASGRYILGEEVEAFEAEVASYVGGGVHAVSCASGTDALWLALRGMGIGPGDGVIVPAFTFFASASAVLAAGAIPVFCDVDPATLTLDPVCVERLLVGDSPPHRRIGVDPGSIRAVMPVHLFGQPADMDVLSRLAGAHGLVVVEDAAQAFGAACGTRKAGSLGAAGCFSFFPTKNLGGFGDGGLVTTSDEEAAGRMRMLRAHGSATRYAHEIAGTNSRLDALQAAMLRVRLATIDERLADRRRLADRYDAALAAGPARVPTRAGGRTHSFNLYVVRMAERDRVAAELGERGIGTAVHYPSPAHLQGAVEHLGYRPGDFPVSEEACGEVLTIPFHPSLAEEDVDRVAEALAAGFSPG